MFDDFSEYFDTYSEKMIDLPFDKELLAFSLIIVPLYPKDITCICNWLFFFDQHYLAVD